MFSRLRDSPKTRSTAAVAFTSLPLSRALAEGVEKLLKKGELAPPTGGVCALRRGYWLTLVRTGRLSSITGPRAGPLWANGALLAQPLAPETHYAHGNSANTGSNTSARRPLACGRKVMPVSSLTIRLQLQTMKVKSAWMRYRAQPR